MISRTSLNNLCTLLQFQRFRRRDYIRKTKFQTNSSLKYFSMIKIAGQTFSIIKNYISYNYGDQTSHEHKKSCTNIEGKLLSIRFARVLM